MTPASTPAAATGRPPARDALGYFSSRGGELAKPDIVAPGIAFSTVPRWDTGSEVKVGTSMATPYAAGLAGCLASALVQEGRRATAAEVVQALRVSARPFNGARMIDEGAGMPVLEAAYQWLEGGHQGSSYEVRAATGVSAAFRRNGFTSGQDSVETFTVRHRAGLRAAQFALHADVPWLSVDDTVDAAPRATQIPVTYHRGTLTTPGVYIGTVTALNPRDTIAGPLFTLVNTVIIPTDLTAKVLFDERRFIAPPGCNAISWRAAAGRHLAGDVMLPDSQGQQATVRLYEPDGEPARSAPQDVDIGKESAGSASITVRAEDMVAGVYELDVVAPPLSGATVTVRADLGPVALAPAQTGGLEASSVVSGQATVTGELLFRLVGAERSYAIAGRGQPAESLQVRAPRWRGAWKWISSFPRSVGRADDLSVTVYDSSGQQLRGGNQPVNYAFGRMSITLSDSVIGIPLTVELYPAFARLPATRGRARSASGSWGPTSPLVRAAPYPSSPAGAAWCGCPTRHHSTCRRVSVR